LGVDVGVFVAGCELFVGAVVGVLGVNFSGGFEFTVRSVMKKLTGVWSVEK
jgi:hypothetical protein